MKTTSFTRAFLPLALLFSFPITTAYLSPFAVGAEIRDVPGYQLNDSGYLGQFPTATHALMGWIDNNRLLFIGARPGDFSDEPRSQGPGGAKAPRFALYMWDLRDGQVRLYHEGHSTSLLCVAADWIYFSYGKQGVPGGYMSEFILSGPFGKEQLKKDSEAEARERRERRLLLNPHSCREYLPSSLPKIEGRVWPLLEGEFISISPADGSRSASPLKYWPQNRKVVLLNLSDEPVGVFRYSEYLSSYVLDESPRNYIFGEKIVRRMWTMDRVGQTKEIVLPAGPWMRGSTFAMPTRKGVFMVSHAIAAQNAGAAGGYLVNGQDVIRIVQGFPHSFAVAQDGCKVALSIGPAEYKGARPYPQVKVLDICSEGK